MIDTDLEMLVGIGICLILSFFFSMSETAIVAANPSRLHKLNLDGNKRAKIVTSLRKNKETFLATMLFGDTLVNILSSALATELTTKYFANDGILIATLVMTFMILIFCEQFPKTYAFEHAEHISMLLAPIVLVFVYLLRPFTVFTNYFVILVTKIVNFGRNNKRHVVSATEEIRGAIELHHHEGGVVKSARDMLGGILDLGDTEVGQIMIHRTKMLSINADLPTSEIVNKILFNNSHTRIPIWKNNPDNIVGVLNVKDLLKAVIDNKDHLDKIDILKLSNKPWFIPETTHLGEQLHQFRKKRNHFALVTDEYGALQGMVTLEDIIEEIVGQIEDEHDIIKNDIIKLSENVYIVSGGENIRDINRQLNLSLPSDDASTIAGLIINEAGVIPEKGQTFKFFDIDFEILEQTDNQINLIKITLEKF